MNDITVTWEIIDANQNIINVAYKHPDVQRVIVSIPLTTTDVTNLAAVIQSMAPYDYFYNALNPAAAAEVANLIGQTGSATLHNP